MAARGARQTQIENKINLPVDLSFIHYPWQTVYSRLRPKGCQQYPNRLKPKPAY